ncbi:aspartate racemase, partial [Candidatus Bathyarchaeota archaeon]
GIIRDKSRNSFERIIRELTERGAEGIVLGCTEIPLLIDEKNISTRIFDTAKIHADKALEFAVKT